VQLSNVWWGLIHGTEQNRTEWNCGLKHVTVAELCKFDRDGQKPAARVLRLWLLPSDSQVSGSTYTQISGWLRGPY